MMRRRYTHTHAHTYAHTEAPTEKHTSTQTHIRYTRTREARKSLSLASGRLAKKDSYCYALPVHLLRQVYVEGFFAFLAPLGDYVGSCWLILAILGAMLAHLGALWCHFVAKLSQDGAKIAQDSSR